MTRRKHSWVIGLAALTIAAIAPTLAQAQPKTLLVYGDSLMAGYGLSQADGFVPQLQKALNAAGADITLVNASVSGDTSVNGLARLDWTLADKPDAVLFGLGANDMLQGLPVAGIEKNLTAILDRFKADNIPVLLAGMMAARGLGPDYYNNFDALYPALAKRYGARLFPFFLDGVALDRSLNQADGVHPNPKGVAIIVKNITPYVIDLMNSVAG